MVDADIEHYQTVFAKHRGSVAAPTAGLHFTDVLLDRLRAMGVFLGEVTLHVGIGTFRPIQVQQLSDHQMHSEWGSLDAATCASVKERRDTGGRCIAVGTTTVRVWNQLQDKVRNSNPGRVKPIYSFVRRIPGH